MTAGANIKRLDTLCQSREYTYRQGNGRTLVTYTPKQGRTISVRMDNEQWTNTGYRPETARKLFVYILAHADADSYTVTVRNKDLINLGIYTSQQNARKGFKTLVDALRTVQININSGNNIPLISGYTANHGTHTLTLNADVCDICKGCYGVLSDSYYRLPDKAADTLLYMFYLLRVNKGKAKSIRLSTLADRIHLSQDDRHQTRRIKAIEQIATDINNTADDISVNLYVPGVRITDRLTEGLISFTASEKLLAELEKIVPARRKK